MPATSSLHDCEQFVKAVQDASGRVPKPLAGILAGAHLLASPSAAPAPAKAIVDAALAGDLTERKLDALVSDAAQQQLLNTCRGELRRDSERMFVAAFFTALKNGAADELLDSLRPAWDEAAEAIAAARALINPESSADHILASAEPEVIGAWQGLNAHIAVIARIAAIVSQFGPRLGQFPLITEYALGDGSTLEDRAILCSNGPLPVDSGTFRQPDRGHRTSPWFKLPLKLHSIESAQARYNEWAAAEFDRIHGGRPESWIDEHGKAHEKPRPTNPFRETGPAT